MPGKKIYLFFILLIFFSFFLNFFTYATYTYASSNPKFLIIHLDAISSRNFFQYMEKGHLPNIKEVFESGKIIKYGLSLFPGGTETIYPRLKGGLDNKSGEIVGWGYYDREKERVVPDYHTFFQLFFSIPRRARASFIYGIPYLDFFMFLPMINIPELLEMYRVIELIWFSTDSTGHALGTDVYLSSIRRFDSYFGRLAKRLDLDKINLILYSDHGMSFDNEIYINHVEEVERVVGDFLAAFKFPNIYLFEPGLKEYYSRKIVLESEIDFAFFKESSGRVTGYSKYGKIIFEQKKDKYRYIVKGEDIFNYYKDGYDGEWLTALEWLSLTRDNKFPGVVPNIHKHLSNENAGDIVLVVNPPKIIHTMLGYSANHHGVTDTDLLVPILLRGEDLEHLYDREEIWLHNLFTSIPALSFDNIEPSREKNSFSFWGSLEEGNDPGFELSLSPAYRWNVAIRYNNDNYQAWFEYDLYSSYVIRLWTGAGLQYHGNQFEPFLQARLQMDFGKVQFNYGVQNGLKNLQNWQENRKELIYKINNRLSFDWQIPNKFGFSFHW